MYKVGTHIPTLFLCLFMALPSSSQSLPDLLTAYIEKLPDSVRVSIAVKALDDQKSVTFTYRADERTPSASVIKLPIMIETMSRVEAGKLDLSAPHTLLASEKVGGSGVLKNYPDNSQLTYQELLRLMMVVSDNTATNIFVNLLGRDTINQRMRTLDLPKSQLNRVMMDTLAARQGRENYVTATEMNTLLEKIYTHQVTPTRCAQMLSILKANQDTLCIARLLPKDVVIAHKTGELTYVRGDVGIVYARQPFLLSVFVLGTPTPEAERIIGELALICYTWFHKP
jgi:beta-lactamase class A